METSSLPVGSGDDGYRAGQFNPIGTRPLGKFLQPVQQRGRKKIALQGVKEDGLKLISLKKPKQN